MTAARTLLVIAVFGLLGACNSLYGPSARANLSPRDARALRSAPVSYTAARGPVVILGVQ